MSCLGFGEAQRPLNADELTCCSAAKAMPTAPLDIQSITPLTHVTFKTVFPLKPFRPVEINEAAREVYLTQYIGMQNLNPARTPALALQFDAFVSTRTLSARRCSVSSMRAPLDRMKRSA